MIEEIMAKVVEDRLAGEFSEEWDIPSLLVDLQTYYPTRLDAATLLSYEAAEDVVALVVEDALSLYQEKCERYVGGLDTAKEIERDVMLQILDQRWRDHLSDMDYLRDGIHLRQVAQQDPLTAWQKEGYLMFEHLLEAVDHDFVRFITHVEENVSVPPEEDVGLERAITNANEVAPGATDLPEHGKPAGKSPGALKVAPKEGDKIGRIEPCWCGSGRKFKQCHGRP